MFFCICWKGCCTCSLWYDDVKGFSVGCSNFFLNMANMDVVQTLCGRAKGTAEWMLFWALLDPCSKSSVLGGSQVTAPKKCLKAPWRLVQQLSFSIGLGCALTGKKKNELFERQQIQNVAGRVWEWYYQMTLWFWPDILKLGQIHRTGLRDETCGRQNKKKRRTARTDKPSWRQDGSGRTSFFFLRTWESKAYF